MPPISEPTRDAAFSPEARGGAPAGPGRRRRIGIIAGSGPEAGVDLWSKTLVANRQAFGERFGGDVDSPPVVIFSEPVLGLSMDLRNHDAAVWDSLERTVQDIVPHVDVFTIACNTLHYYAPRIEEIRGGAVFLDVADIVRSHIRTHACGPVALMGSGSVASLDEWSPYLALHREVSFETPPDLADLHALIGEIKLLGHDTDDIRRRFVEIVSRLRASTVFLACTELPLIHATVPGKSVIDVNRLLAESLVRHSFGEDGPAMKPTASGDSK